MKNTFKLIGIIAIIAVVGLLVSCGGGLSGTYKFDDMDVFYTFSGNKITFKSGEYIVEGTFKASGGLLSFTIEGLEESATYKYTVKGKTLTLDDGEHQSTLTKQ